MRRYKVGILGTGVISRTYLADIQAFYHSLQVVACADLLQERAQTLAKEFSVPRACTVEELLQAQDIEIIVNLTPPQAHVEVDRKILEASKHLFSEKPFAPTLAQAKDLLELATRKGVQVGCAPDTFLASGLQSMRCYLDAGLIGKPFFVTANMTSAGQFAGLQVIIAGGTLLEMAVTQFIINLRYALMSLSLSQKLSDAVTFRERLVIAFANTDEIFAVAVGRGKSLTFSYMLGLQLCWDYSFFRS